MVVHQFFQVAHSQSQPPSIQVSSLLSLLHRGTTTSLELDFKQQLEQMVMEEQESPSKLTPQTAAATTTYFATLST
jgi:hypothetical protein